MLATSWKTYSEFYRRSRYSKFPQEHRSSKGKLEFRMIQSDQGPHNFADPEVSETVISLPLSVDGRCNLVATYGASSHRLTSEPSRMIVIPADVESHWEVDRHRQVLMLTVPNNTLREVLGPACPREIGTAFAKLSQDTWTDSLVEVLMRRLWENSAGSEAADVYLADGLLVSVVSQLLIRAGTSLDMDATISLPQWRLRRVEQYVETHFHEHIDVDDLAAAAGLGRRHFARSFHREVGETPHRWLMQRRLRKAQDLLVSTEQPLCAIAESCGFASQSHLTKVLKEETGMTPYRWRTRFRE
jgi:AraC family transcriptional regulator